TSPPTLDLGPASSQHAGRWGSVTLSSQQGDSPRSHFSDSTAIERGFHGSPVATVVVSGCIRGDDRDDQTTVNPPSGSRRRGRSRDEASDAPHRHPSYGPRPG